MIIFKLQSLLIVKYKLTRGIGVDWVESQADSLIEK